MRRLKTLLAAACLMVGMLATVLGVQAASQADLDDPGYYKYYGLGGGETIPDETKARGALTPYATANTNPYTGRIYTHDPRKSGTKVVYGIDVSKYQGNIDWKRVKAADIKYAFIRAGYSGLANGSHAKDPYFDQNMKNAQAAGIKVGVYYYSQATTAEEAKSEAKYLLELIKGYTLDYPVVFDAEEGTYKNSSGKQVPGKLGAAVQAINDDKEKTAAEKKKAIKNIYNSASKAFCDAVRSAGYTPMIYGGMEHILNKMDGAELSKTYMMWIPRYNTILNDSKYTYNGNYQFWQYSSTGLVDGITGFVDCNFLYLSGNEDVNWKQGGSGWSNPGNTVPSNPPENPEAPDNPEVPDAPSFTGTISNFTVKASGKSKIKLSWSLNGQAAFYDIYRADACYGTYKKVKNVTGSSWSDTGLAEGREYYYYVIPVGADGTQGTKSAIGRAYTSSDTKVYVKTTANLNMRKEADVSSGQVLVLPQNTKVYRYCETRSADGIVWYKVKYTKSGKTYTGYISSRYATVAVNPLSGVKQSVRAKTSVTISWKKQSGVTACQVYRATARNGKYTKIATIKDLNTKSYKDTGLKSNREYWYKVRAYSKVNGQTTYGTAVILCATTRTSSSKVKTKSATSLYQYAGTAFKKMVSIPKNTKVTVLNNAVDKSGAAWYKVKYTKNKKTYNAYIKKSLTKKA